MIGRRGSRAAVIVATVVGLGVALAPPAFAHDKLVSSTPFEGERLDAMPTHIVLRFEEPPTSGYTAVRVYDPSGAQLALPVESIGSIVTVPLAAAHSAGQYVIRWSVLSDDGHPVSGVIHFDLLVGGSGHGNGTAARPSARSAASASLAWVAVAVAALSAMLVVAAMRGARRRARTSASSRAGSRA